MTLHEAIRRGIGYTDQEIINRLEKECDEELVILKRNFEEGMAQIKHKQRRIEFLKSRDFIGGIYKSMLEVEA